MNSKERVLFSQEAFNWGTPYSAEPIKQMYTYEGLLNMYLSHDISSEEFLAQRNVLETQNTDWFKLLTRRAFSHNHNLSVPAEQTNTVIRLLWDIPKAKDKKLEMIVNA